MIHVLASLALSTQIYYMGRFKIGECCDQTISSQCVLSSPACVAQSCGPSSGLPCPLTPLMLSWPLKSLCCCFPEQWESAGAVCSAGLWGSCPSAAALPSAVLRGVIYTLSWGEGLLGSLALVLCL